MDKKYNISCINSNVGLFSDLVHCFEYIDKF